MLEKSRCRGHLITQVLLMVMQYEDATKDGLKTVLISVSSDASGRNKKW